MKVQEPTRLEAMRALIRMNGEPGTVITYRVPQCEYCGRQGPRAPDGSCLGCGAVKAA